ncbi:hypothetical protein ACOSQ4_018222 [Xanthoceras sorbifolium]
MEYIIRSGGGVKCNVKLPSEGVTDWAKTFLEEFLTVSKPAQTSPVARPSPISGFLLGRNQPWVAAGISVDNAEALALLGMLASFLSLVESDSKVVVDLINGRGSSSSDLGLIVSH